MIASAAALPEADAAPTSRSPSPSLKRKLSGTSSPDAKRTRRENSDAAPDEPAAPEPQTSPARRNRNTAQEEKKRTQRLFSSLLGTLSQRGAHQNDASTARRAEIEQRQRERLRKDAEEREAESKRRRSEVLERRRRERQRWDEEGREVRWKSERYKAGFLRTKTEPVLFWRPWELLKEEKERVKMQREEVERRIERERREVEGRGEHNDASELATEGLGASRIEVPPDSEQDSEQKEVAEQQPEQTANASDEAVPDERQIPPDVTEDVAGVVKETKPPDQALHGRDAEDDHQGGVLVEGEGQEDDILY